MVKPPQRSRENDRHSYGENRNDQTSNRVPARRIPCTVDTSVLSKNWSQRSRNKNANDDDKIQEPE